MIVQSISVFLWIRIARICRKYERAAAERLRLQGLNLAQFDLLTALSTSEETTQFDLAKQLLVTQGNITQLVAKLENRGLLTRRQEGRTKYLMLTDQGREMLDAILPAHTAWNAEQFVCLSSQEQKQLLALLRKLDHTLK